MTGAESNAGGLEARMNSMSLAGSDAQKGTSRPIGGATALTNTTWLAAQQRKAAHQPFQPRPLKMVANLEGKTNTRAPLVSKHAIGNVPASAPTNLDKKVARTPSLTSLRAREDNKPTQPPATAASQEAQFDLGRYDGGLERDENKGRRNTSVRLRDEGDTLAMDSSLDG